MWLCILVYVVWTQKWIADHYSHAVHVLTQVSHWTQRTQSHCWGQMSLPVSFATKCGCSIMLCGPTCKCSGDTARWCIFLAVARAIRNNVLNVNVYNDNLPAGAHVFSRESTADRSNTYPNECVSGLILNTSFKKRDTRGCLPTDRSWSACRIDDSAERCRPTVRQANPLITRKFK